MKRLKRLPIILGVLASLISPISAQAVSANPTPVCSGSTCTVTFTYTGDFYQWTAPVAGTFTLEVWGAQGGNAAYAGSVITYGGKGGYAKGSRTFTSGQTLYIYVGGQGDGGGTANNDKMLGGFNGGGFGYNGNNSTNRGAGGGGGTDIRIASDTLATRAIVAGGGAGGSYYPTYSPNFPGVGGGLTGGTGAVTNYNSLQYQGQGGTQTYGGPGGTNGSTGTAGSLGVGGNGGSAYGYSEGGGGGGYYGGGAAGTGMASGGGSGYVGSLTTTTLTAGNASMPNPAGGLMTGNTGNGVARITYPGGPMVTKFAPRTAASSTGTTVFDLIFSETVTGLSAGDFGMTGPGAGSCGQFIVAGSGMNYTLTLNNCAAGTTQVSLNANTVTNSGSQLGPSSIQSTNMIVDFTFPTISSLSAPSSATYKPADTPTFTMIFSESMTITGTPRLILTVGSETRYANYLSMSDSKTALFRYTVGNTLTEFDVDGIEVATNLDLNGSTVTDIATNNLSSFGFTAPTLTGVKVAQRSSAPSITSITPGNAQLSINFTAGSTNGSAVTNYKYSLNAGTFVALSPADTTTPLVITGLTNGTSYSVRILAVNIAGDGDSSTAVSATPSTVVVGGGSTISRAYGSISSSSAFTASGGTSPYVFSLTGASSGITIDSSTGVVTASNTLAAGTYAPSVVATDSNGTPRVGSLGISIVITQETPTVTISLPGASSNAALGGAVTITASVSKDGVLVFKVDGSIISGCSAVSSSAGTATCTWTPGALGGVVLTATLAPTDSTNYRSVTSVDLSITVVNGVSSVTLSLTGGTTTPQKSTSINIIAAVNQAGKISIYIDGKRLAGCFNKSASAGNMSCTWKPAVQKQVNITARLVPTNSVYNSSSSSLIVQVVRRTGTR